MIQKSFRKYLLIPLFSILFFGWSGSTAFAQIANDSTEVRKAIVFPNPFSGEVTIQINKIIEDIEEVIIYDYLGSIIFTFGPADWSQGIIEWNGANLSNGTYIVFIRTREDNESILIQKN